MSSSNLPFDSAVVAAALLTLLLLTLFETFLLVERQACPLFCWLLLYYQPATAVPVAESANTHTRPRSYNFSNAVVCLFCSGANGTAFCINDAGTSPHHGHHPRQLAAQTLAYQLRLVHLQRPGSPETEDWKAVPACGATKPF